MLTKFLDTSSRPVDYSRTTSSPPRIVPSSPSPVYLFAEPLPVVGVPLLVLTGCRFAVSDDGDTHHLFCNAEKQCGNYCAHHHAICYRKTPDIQPFFDSVDRSNIAQPSKPKAATRPKSESARQNLKRARAARASKHVRAGPFYADSLRGTAYRLLLCKPMTLDDLMAATGWALKVARETLCDIATKSTHKGQYKLNRQDGMLWITLTPDTPDVSAMIA